MSKIGNLSVRPKIVKIGETELTLIPLSFKERASLAKILDAKGKAEQVESTFDLIKKVLQKSYPDMTDLEFDDLSIEYINDVTKVVLELHGLSVSEEDLKKMAAEKARG